MDLYKFKVTKRRSQLFIEECMRLIQETEKGCKRMQENDVKHLDKRVKDIQFLKKELELRLKEIIEEIEMLIALRSRVVKALDACKEPLRVTILCLEERRNHSPTMEKPQDEVDSELMKEKEVIEEVAALLQRVVEQITEQIRRNQAAKFHLEQDRRDKYEAQCNDSSCNLMTIHSIKDQPKNINTITNLLTSPVTPEQWEAASEKNIAKAEEQKTLSLSLRALVESLLEQTGADMQEQVQATTAAFQLNISEIRSAKSQMEDQLNKTLSELTNQLRIREDLLVAIAEKEQALALAKARIEMRHLRPFNERIHDLVQTQLLTEVQQVTGFISRLRDAVAQSDEMQRALVRCQRELQKNINLKTTSLYVDEVTCAQHREPIVIHNF